MYVSMYTKYSHLFCMIVDVYACNISSPFHLSLSLCHLSLSPLSLTSLSHLPLSSLSLTSLSHLSLTSLSHLSLSPLSLTSLSPEQSPDAAGNSHPSPPLPTYQYEIIQVSSLAGMAPHLQINPQVLLICH